MCGSVAGLDATGTSDFLHHYRRCGVGDASLRVAPSGAQPVEFPALLSGAIRILFGADSPGPWRADVFSALNLSRPRASQCTVRALRTAIEDSRKSPPHLLLPG